jgi:hypothetical protein
MAKIIHLGTAKALDRWDRFFDEYKTFQKKHGSGSYMASFGKGQTPLGLWVANNRAKKTGSYWGAKLTEDQIKRLNSIGFMWEATKLNDVISEALQRTRQVPEAVQNYGSPETWKRREFSEVG